MEHTLSIKKNALFSKIYKKGNCLVSGLLIMYVLPNGLDFNRFGITVSKKVGKACKRNRAKRLIRESYRFLEMKASGYDFVFVARTKTPEVGFFEVKKEMEKLYKKAGLI